MTKILLSNPPFNIPYENNIALQSKYIDFDLSKISSNFAFMLYGLSLAKECSFILPIGVLGAKRADKKALKYIVDNNLLEGILLLPDNMFESTKVSTVIIKLNKNKRDTLVYFIDLRKSYKEIERKQKGQFGDAAHTKREYLKKIKIISRETIEKVVEYIKNNNKDDLICEKVDIKEIREKEYSLNLSNYTTDNLFIDSKEYRPVKDIIRDINNIVRDKNNCKLTINETLAKQIGFDIEHFKEKNEYADVINQYIEKLDAEKIIYEDYISFSKNKNEIKFENKDKDNISSVLQLTITMFRQHLFYLNKKHNEYLAELRDTMLPKLMSGEIELTED